MALPKDELGLGGTTAAHDHVEPFRRLADAIPHVFWITQLNPEQVLYVSPSFEQIWGRTPQELYDDPRVWAACIHPDDREHVEATFVGWITGQERICRKMEYRVVQPSGALRWVTDHGVVTYDEQSRAVRVSGVSTDITELKLAERKHLSHLWFLESLDRVSQAIQRTDDLERMVSDVLDEVQRIFRCDRAWLVSQGEPPADAWQLVMEQARPGYVSDQTVNHATAAGVGQLFSRITEDHGIRSFEASGAFQLPYELSASFQVRAMLCTALRSTVGTRYVLGIHQCDQTRSWSEEEAQLFREIGRRLADAIRTLWTFRKLRESEARLEAAQRQAHLGYWSLDLETELVTWSAETYRIHGMTPRERPLRSDELRSLVHPRDAERVSDAQAHAMRESGNYVVEYRAVRPSSELRYVHSDGHVVRDAAGRLKSLFGTVQDITERKQAEQLFAAHHAVTTLLAEGPALQEGVPRILEVICERLGWDLGILWQLDTQGQALRCAALWLRPGACGSAYAAAIRDRRFELDDELIGEIWAKREPAFISDIALSAKSARAQLATSDGLHATFGFPVLVGSNVWGVMEFFSQEVRQPEQDLLTTMATLASQIGQFVERKEAETALRDARDQLAHVTRIASLGEMTASIAHEVNQPLTGIIANAHAALQWLSREPPELQEATDCIQRLVRDGRRAGNVVAGLRNLIRRGDKTCKVSVDLNQLVRETIPLVRGEIQRIEATLELDLCPELAPVLGDRVQVQQLLLNVIVNAVESMSTACARPARLTIRSLDEGVDLVGVSVQDTGIGLRTEDMGRIFDAFFTTKPQGLGMGLAISRSIVEDHGGRLSASSRLGEGSIFQFTLRKAPADS